jgi:uracil-DNA glycosylase
MRWSERQLAMLREMGIRLWSPEPAQAEAEVAVATPPQRPVPAVGSAGQTAARAPAVAPTAAEAQRAAPAVAVVRAPLAGGAAAGVGTLDWPALREAVAACTACKLCTSRTQTVFGVGHPNAHWMLVGEGPGEQEDLQGEPFVGKSGQLLDNMLRAVALRRGDGSPAQQVYIANAVKCRPPNNRHPEPDELAACAAFLARQVALVQPRIIVALGRAAVQSLLGSHEPIGRLRGRVHRYQDVPLIVTYHPAYLLRSPTEKARAWEDLCLAMDTLAAAAPR